MNMYFSKIKKFMDEEIFSRKGLCRFFRLQIWLGIFAVVFATRTYYRPSLVMVLVAVVISAFMLFAFVVEIRKEDSLYKKWEKRMSGYKAIAVAHFVSFLLVGVYLLGFSLNYFIGTPEGKIVFAIPKGDTGRKQLNCSTTVLIVDRYNIEESERYCFSDKEYADLKNRLETAKEDKDRVFFAYYKTSPFGRIFSHID